MSDSLRRMSKIFQRPELVALSNTMGSLLMLSWSKKVPWWLSLILWFCHWRTTWPQTNQRLCLSLKIFKTMNHILVASVSQGRQSWRESWISLTPCGSLFLTVSQMTSTMEPWASQMMKIQGSWWNSLLNRKWPLHQSWPPQKEKWESQQLRPPQTTWDPLTQVRRLNKRL